MSEQRYRVGFVGLQPGRSWASVAHLPALRAMPDRFDIVGVANTEEVVVGYLAGAGRPRLRRHRLRYGAEGKDPPPIASVMRGDAALVIRATDRFRTGSGRRVAIAFETEARTRSATPIQRTTGPRSSSVAPRMATTPSPAATSARRSPLRRVVTKKTAWEPQSRSKVAVGIIITWPA